MQGGQELKNNRYLNIDKLKENKLTIACLKNIFAKCAPL